MTALDPHLLDQLWQRSPTKGSPASEEARLSALFDVWCRTVPYDTATKIVRLAAAPRRRLWGLDPDELVATALETGLGGSCFPLAFGFAAAARADGFTAAVHPAGSSSFPSEHAVVVISGRSGRWLCDPAFLHLAPARLDTAAEHRVGPLWSPLWVNPGGAPSFTIERGTSTERRSYQLGEPLDDAGVRDAYEVAGRWASGLELYMRRACCASQEVLSGLTLTVKDAGGVCQHHLTVTERDTWLERSGVSVEGRRLVAAASGLDQ